MYSCHSSFGLKGAPSENLLQMMMKKSLMRRSPTKFQEPKFLISPKLKIIAKTKLKLNTTRTGQKVLPLNEKDADIVVFLA